MQDNSYPLLPVIAQSDWCSYDVVTADKVIFRYALRGSAIKFRGIYRHCWQIATRLLPPFHIRLLLIILSYYLCNFPIRSFQNIFHTREFRREAPKDNGLLFINTVFNELSSSPRYSLVRQLWEIKRLWWIFAIAGPRVCSSRGSDLSTATILRPRWQLKFHFNPEFPQYFSIPCGLVVLSVVSRQRRRRAESLHSWKQQGKERRCNDGGNKGAGRSKEG